MIRAAASTQTFKGLTFLTMRKPITPYVAVLMSILAILACRTSDQRFATNSGNINSSVATPSATASPLEGKSFSFVAQGGNAITGHVYPNAQKPNRKTVVFSPLLEKSDGNLYNASLNSLWSAYGKKRGLFQMVNAETKFDSAWGGNAVCWNVFNPNELFCVFPVKDAETGNLAALHIWLE